MVNLRIFLIQRSFMKKVMIPLVVLLVTGLALDLYAGRNKKTNKPTYIKVNDIVIAENLLDAQEPGLLYDLFNRLHAAAAETNKPKKLLSQTDTVLNALLKKYQTKDNQKPEFLIDLYKGLYASITFDTPKLIGQKKCSQRRAIFDVLNIYGNAKAVVDGMAADLTDDENNLNEYWNCESHEDLADPTAVYLGILAGTTSHWKNCVYEKIKRDLPLINETKDEIEGEERAIALLQKQLENRQNRVRRLNQTLETFEKKLESADNISTNLIEDLTRDIEDLLNTMNDFDATLAKFEIQASEIRNNKALDAKSFNAKMNAIKEEKDTIIKAKKEAGDKKVKLEESLKHVSEHYAKVREDGSLGRRYIWGKKHTIKG
jgi:predicted component of type VI protein secretion system